MELIFTVFKLMFALTTLIAILTNYNLEKTFMLSIVTVLLHAGVLLMFNYDWMDLSSASLWTLTAIMTYLRLKSGD